MIASNDIQERVEENLHDYNLTVEKLADLLHISPSLLRELSRLYFAMSPHQYIESRRMTRALQLLTLPIPLTELCRQIGYNCVRSFRRAFHMAVGMTPSAFRKKVLHTK
jgi:AraC-like DNA-binding protein